MPTTQQQQIARIERSPYKSSKHQHWWRKIHRWILLFLMTFLLTLVGSHPFLVTSGSSAIMAQTPSAANLTQQATTLFQQQRFAESAAIWQEAATTYQALGDQRNQAMALGNRAFALQYVGQWQQAREAIATSQALLQSLQANDPRDQASLRIYAQTLDIQGRHEFFTGQFQTALETWEQATAIYQQLGDDRRQMQSQLNQVQTAQRLGQFQQAYALLSETLNSLEHQEDSELQILGWQNAGNVLWRVGRLQDAEQYLRDALRLAEQRWPQYRNTIQLDLANVWIARGERQQAIGKGDEARNYLENAIALYQTIAEQSRDPDLQLRSRLNQFHALVRSTNWQIEASTSTNLFLDDIPTYAAAIQNLLDAAEPTRTGIYAGVQFMQDIIQLQQMVHLPEELSAVNLAHRLVNLMETAQTLNDIPSKAYILGTLGHLYETTGQIEEARSLTERSLFLLQPIHAPEISYELQWQLGRLLKTQWEASDRTDQGLLGQAIATYKSAITTLNTVRKNLLVISPDIQFSFRDQVEPVYRQLVDLLLSHPDNESPSQRNLRESITYIDALQLAELEDYLGCELAQRSSLDTIQDAGTAILHLIILPERIATVGQFSGDNPSRDNALEFREWNVPESEAETFLQRFRSYLEKPGGNPDVLASARELYTWLIAPLEEILDTQSIQTLVFMPDRSLRNIPMSVLRDDQGEYLIQKYAIAIAPQLEIFRPVTSHTEPHVFLGGVGEYQTIEGMEFDEIRLLSEELDAIHQQVASNDPLINSDFTDANIRQSLMDTPYSMIHIKTHGIFSSDPDETFLVGYNQLIKGYELRDLTATSNASNPLELLSMSACSSAEGDERAVLGMSGFAIHAGARSVLSSLWDADDVVNTELMKQFYQTLTTQPGITKAEALRQAQINLIGDRQVPHYWATYVLVGNWL